MTVSPRFLVALASTVLNFMIWFAAPLWSQGEPTVMVVVAEKVSGVFDTTGFEEPRHVEGLLSQALADRGFKVLDFDALERRVGAAKARQLLEGDEVAAREVALLAEAEYVLSGTAMSKPAGTRMFGTNMQSLQGSVTLKFTRADGRLLGSSTGQAAEAHLDEVQGGMAALTKATETVLEELARLFDRVLSAQGIEAADITLQVKNLVSARHLDFLLGYLQNDLDGVADARLRGYHGGVAEIALDSTSSARLIGREINAARFTGFRLEVTHLSSHLIEIESVLDE